MTFDSNALLDDALTAAENGNIDEFLDGDNAADDSADKVVTDETSDEQNTDDTVDEKETADNTDETDTEPDTEPAEEKEDADNTDDNQVILAKDGKHHIPYSKLTEARDSAKAEKARADALQAELDALKSQAKQKPAAEKENAEDEDGLFDDEEDGAFLDKKGIEKIVQQAVANIVGSQIQALQKQQEATIAEKHFTAIYTAHPDADSVIESTEWESWVEKQPSYYKNAINQVLQNGTSGEVIELLNNFKAATKQPETPQQKIAQTVKDKVAKAQAKQSVPDTLSDFDGAKADIKSGRDNISTMSMNDMLDFSLNKKDDEIDQYL